MNHLHASLSFAFAAALAAQETPAATTPATAQAPAATDDASVNAQAAARLQKALLTTATLPSCSFRAHWGPAEKTAAGDDKEEEDEKDEAPAAGAARMVAINLMAEASAAGDAEGAWSSGNMHLVLGDDELRYEGRTLLAKDATRPWTLRSGRFADGNELDFVPDPQRLLAVLRAMPLEVVRREASALGDRPVEVLTVSLTHEQAAELVFGDLLPGGVDPFGGGFAAVIRGRMVAAGGGGAARAPATVPDTTIDLALYLDPGSGLLHRVQVRSYRKSEAQFAAGGGRMVFVAGGGAVVHQAGGDDEEDEEEEKPAAGKGAPAQFADALPVRSRKKMMVADFVLDLTEHGKATLPELDAGARALLGR